MRKRTKRDESNQKPAMTPTLEPLPEPYDPRLGPKPPEMKDYRPKPIPVPSHLKGGYMTCGGCGSYIRPDLNACPLCAPRESVATLPKMMSGYRTKE